MRILFTTVQRHGHLQPLLPIAHAARTAGHAVAVACAASFVPHVERAGLPAFPAGFDERGRLTPTLFPGLRTVPEQDAASWLIPRLSIGVWATAMTPDLLTIAGDWHPDLIVRDAMEYGGCVAAEVLDLPHTAVRSGSTTSRYGFRLHLAAALDRLRELNGLPPDPEVAMPFRYLHLAAEPPGFVLPGEVAPPTTHRLRPIEADRAGDEALPPWVAALPARPTIYATLGTSYHGSTPSGRAIYAAVLAALRDAPVNLILTVGRERDPAQFGPQPPHVHIERYIPQSLLVPHCDLVVSHGGFNTVTGVLAAGLPMVVIPMSADQPYNAACCAALGVGRVIGPGERSAAAIGAAVRMVLEDATYRRNAERVREGMLALPGPEHAVGLLERLVAEKRPILAE